MPAVSDQFDLGFSISFDDLYSREGLLRLDRRFCEHLEASDCALHARLLAARANPAALAPLDQSELIIALAPLVEDFIGELFGIVPEIQALQVRHNQFAPFFSFKRKFIQKRAISGVTRDQAAAIDGPALRRELETRFGEPVTERSRDNFPNPVQRHDNPYVPVNSPALGDLFDLFDFSRSWH